LQDEVRATVLVTVLVCLLAASAEAANMKGAAPPSRSGITPQDIVAKAMLVIDDPNAQLHGPYASLDAMRAQALPSGGIYIVIRDRQVSGFRAQRFEARNDQDLMDELDGMAPTDEVQMTYVGDTEKTPKERYGKMTKVLTFVTEDDRASAAVCYWIHIPGYDGSTRADEAVARAIMEDVNDCGGVIVNVRGVPRQNMFMELYSALRMRVRATVSTKGYKKLKIVDPELKGMHDETLIITKHTCKLEGKPPKKMEKRGAAAPLSPAAAPKK